MATVTRGLRYATTAIAGVAVVVVAAGSALAISGGGYTSAKQGCGIKADSHNREHKKQPAGCHDIQVLVHDGAGHTYLEVGTDTTKEGDNLHAADLMISPDGTGTAKGQARHGVQLHLDTHYQPVPAGQCGVFDLLTFPIDLLTGSHCRLDPGSWRMPSKLPTVTPKVALGNGGIAAPDLTDIRVYLGADDGLDSGEHDEPDGKHGTSHEQIGPSDGGSVVLNWHPLAIASWLPLVLSGLAHGNASRLAQNPLPVADAGAGACADGICISVQSKRRDAFKGGGGTGTSRDVYDYDGKSWDPYSCSGASVPAEQACHDKTHRNEDAYQRQEARHVRLQPGVQFYEDPDPNGSPLLPAYPLPAVYIGSCGVTLGGGPLRLPKSALTNDSGQLTLSPARC